MQCAAYGFELKVFLIVCGVTVVRATWSASIVSVITQKVVVTVVGVVVTVVVVFSGCCHCLVLLC